MKNFLNWFNGQGVIFRIGLIIIVLAGLVAAFKTVEGIVTHGTDVAVTKAAEAGAAGAVVAGQKEVLGNVQKANDATVKFETDQRANDGRSCSAWDECVRSNRGGPSACVRFLPHRSDDKPVDCARAGR
jgi:hypothetical protein